MEESSDIITFKSLGIVDVLCEACERLKWEKPSKIQQEVIPVALTGKDIIGLAETGSGKTGAFALPIVQALLEKQTKLFALVLIPTRELAVQVAEQFEALGASVNLKCAVIIGGVDIKTQKQMLEKRPHIVIATPGRIADHLKHTKGFHLKTLKYLVLDEADKLLNPDFEKEINVILSAIPMQRNTYLFSATMTSKVAKLQRASLQDPVRIEVSNKLQAPSNLQQWMIVAPETHKYVYLVFLLNQLDDKSIIIFCDSCLYTQETALTLRILGFGAIPLHGQLTQSQRQGLLTKFRSKQKSILVATNVASRGLDIPHVDVVINFSMPTNSKDYIHRIGRTARAGKKGEAFTIVTQYDVIMLDAIEVQLGYKLEKYEIENEEVMIHLKTVTDAHNMTLTELENNKNNKGRKRKHTIYDVPVAVFKKKKY